MKDSISRDNTFDIMKCIGIYAIIIGHLITTGRHIVFTFHVPLFFIISGYFYHRKKNKTAVIQDIRRLVLPYASTCLLIIAYYTYKTLYIGDDFVSKWLIPSIYGSGSLQD